MSTNAPVQTYLTILHGPSVDRAFDSYKYLYDPDAKVLVTFDVQIGRLHLTLTGEIAVLTYESGTPGCLNIELRTNSETYVGYYDARRREGTLKKK